MTHFSFAQVIKGALTGQKNWTPQWPDAQPKAAYDVVIVGAGGHGLGAAYYLAKEHGITNVAVIDKGWLGGGNTGRNTTIIRSNYLYDESARLYDHALDLWEDLSQELNYNVMFSKRGVLMLAHNVHDVQSFQRHVHSNRLNGVDNALADREGGEALLPAARHLALRPLPGDGRRAAAPRRHRPPRRRRLGLRPRRRRPRRRHHPELPGDRDPPRPGRPGHRRRDRQGLHRREEGRGLRRRPHLGRHGDRRRPAAARDPTRCRRWSPSRSSRSSPAS